jgi:hypothetical protein
MFAHYLHIASQLENNGSLPPGTFSTQQMTPHDEPRYWGQFPRSVFLFAQDVVLNRQIFFETSIPRAKLNKLIELTRATYTFDYRPFSDDPTAAPWLGLVHSMPQQGEEGTTVREASGLPFESDYVTVEHGDVIVVDSLQIIDLFDTVSCYLLQMKTRRSAKTRPSDRQEMHAFHGDLITGREISKIAKDFWDGSKMYNQRQRRT